MVFVKCYCERGHLLARPAPAVGFKVHDLAKEADFSKLTMVDHVMALLKGIWRRVLLGLPCAGGSTRHILNIQPPTRHKQETTLARWLDRWDNHWRTSGGVPRNKVVRHSTLRWSHCHVWFQILLILEKSEWRCYFATGSEFTDFDGRMYGLVSRSTADPHS